MNKLFLKGAVLFVLHLGIVGCGGDGGGQGVNNTQGDGSSSDGVDAAAMYSLDSSASSLYYITSKNIHTVETNTFGALSGSINDAGDATLQIDLSSVDTAIAIRDQRVRDLLFEVNNYPTANISLNVDLSTLNNIVPGSSQLMDVTATLDLHGMQGAINTSVYVSKISDSQILVRSSAPLIVNAADYSLTDGIEVLRDLAGLAVISYAVPVNFTLLFNAL